MSKPLEVKCFEDGFRLGMILAASGQIKSGRAAMTALRRRELAALGERLFREAKSPSGPLQGLKTMLLPGYGQMRALRHLISGYPTMLRNAGADRGMAKKLFQQQLQQHFAEIGEVAAPKIKLWNQTMPMAGGAAAGAGLGVVGGRVAGQSRMRDEVNQSLDNMPLWERMKYLLNQKHFDIGRQTRRPSTNPQSPYESRTGEDSEFQ